MDGKKLGLYDTARIILSDSVKSIEASYKCSIYAIQKSEAGPKYIGSTTRTLPERLEWHKRIIKGSKFGEYMKEYDQEMRMTLIKELEVRTIMELTLEEDYHIYKSDTIKSGLNTRYNTIISKIIHDEGMSITNKYDEIRCIIMEYSKYEILYNEYKSDSKNYESITDKRDGILDMDKKYWNEAYGVMLYNPLKLINNNIRTKTEENLKENMYGAYIIYWNDESCYIAVRQGGIKNLITNKKELKKDKMIYNMMKNKSDPKIIPISYFESEDREKIKMYTKKLNCSIKKGKNKGEIISISTILSNIYSLKELLEYSKVMSSKEIQSTMFEIGIKNNENMISQMLINNRTYTIMKNEIVGINEENVVYTNIEIFSGTDNETNKIENEYIGGDIETLLHSNENKRRELKLGRPPKYKTEEEKKEAQLEASRQWRLNNREKVKDFNKKYYDENVKKINN